MASVKNAALKPNDVVGIIGGGQLGRMLAVAAARLGLRTIVLEPDADCPAAQVCDRVIVAAYDDEAALAELAERSAVVTYEFENVPLSAANFVGTRLDLFPPAKALQVAQDRLAEKRFMREHGIPVADFVPVETAQDLAKGLKAFGQGVLKTCRFGYDGKGQHVFKQGMWNGDDLPGILSAVMPDGSQAKRFGCVLEAFVPFEKEFSVIATRAVCGDITTFPISINTHENGILRHCAVRENALGAELEATAVGHVRTLMDALDYVGTIGVEFFALDGAVLVNEMAPRVHNTGHWTVEACVTDQFEQHIRAVSGFPLGSSRMHALECEMDNLLGGEADNLEALLSNPENHLTLYGKRQARDGRKMGHVTRLSSR